MTRATGSISVVHRAQRFECCLGSHTGHGGRKAVCNDEHSEVI